MSDAVANGPILVSGGGGQVGRAVRQAARARGIQIEAPDRSQLDLLNPVAVDAMVASRRWRAIVNCAAYTAVDRAESEPEAATAVNAGAAGDLARVANEHGIPLIHISTDYVFDGRKRSPYVEDDPVGPIGVYGRTKAAGEAAVRAANPRHVILRTAWVLSAGPANFLDTMLRLGEVRDEIGVVADQFGCPTSADDLALAILTIAAAPGRYGTWHFVNAGETSWHGLAEHIFERSAAHGLRRPRLKALTSDEYPTPAARPKNSRLETGAITRDFGIVPRPWRAAVDDLVARKLASGMG